MGLNDLTAQIEPNAHTLKGGVAGHARLFEAKDLLEDPMPQVLGNAWTGIRHGELQVLWGSKPCKLPRRHTRLGALMGEGGLELGDQWRDIGSALGPDIALQLEQLAQGRELGESRVTRRLAASVGHRASIALV